MQSVDDLWIDPASKGERRRPSVRAVLSGTFNVLALNFSIVLASLIVVTAPLAISAGIYAIYRWRYRGHSGVAGSFFTALVTRPWSKWAVMGPAVAVCAVGGLEVAYFIAYFVQYPGFLPILSATIGFLTCVIGVSLMVHLALLMATSPDLRGRDLWRLAVAVGARTVWTTLPLLVVEGLLALLIALADPPLVVVVIPALLLWAWTTTAVWGARRVGIGLVAASHAAA